MLKKCRKIVGHFKHSPANSVELEEQQRRLSRKPEVLIQDAATRWNSTLLMIQRIVDNKEPVLALLADPQHKHSLALPKEADWEKLRILQSLLEPCRYATELLGGERYISCSVILPTFCHLFHAMEPSDDDPAYVVRFKETFVADLHARKENLNLPWLKVATALDPRFKLLKCMAKEERDEVWKGLQAQISRAEADLKRNTPDAEGKAGVFCLIIR